MQTKRQSLLEVAVNTGVGFLVAIPLNEYLQDKALGVSMTHSQSFWLVAVFTLVSVLRSYVIRRGFNWLGQRKGKA